MKKNLNLLLILILVVSIGLVVFNNSRSKTLSNEPLAEFAIEDTSKVDKIIIQDQTGEVAKLQRIPGNKLWKLNDKYFAREDAVNLLLKTFNRIRIRGNVSDASRDNMMKMMVAGGKKVQIFTGGDEPAKIYYIGVPTPDHTGTHMLLEIPEIGRSNEPYITHIEGFTGFLSTRFFTSETEWRYTGVFEYPSLDFQQVNVQNHINPAESFVVTYKGGNQIAMYNGLSPANLQPIDPIAQFDTVAIKNFLLNFKKMHVESFATNLPQNEIDSIARSQPSFTISVIDNKGIVKKVDLYRKSTKTPFLDENGNVVPYDQGYIWAKTMEGDIALAQTYTFDPVTQPKSIYLR